MMIHNAWCIGIGNAIDLRKLADTLDKVSASIAQTYVDKTGKTLDEITAMMNAESWLSASDCVANGFATTIAGESDEGAMALARSFKALTHLKAVPDSMKAQDRCECDCSDCMVTIARSARSRIAKIQTVSTVRNRAMFDHATLGGKISKAIANASVAANNLAAALDKSDKSDLSLFEARLRLLTLGR